MTLSNSMWFCLIGKVLPVSEVSVWGGGGVQTQIMALDQAQTRDQKYNTDWLNIEKVKGRVEKNCYRKMWSQPLTESRRQLIVDNIFAFFLICKQT